MHKNALVMAAGNIEGLAWKGCDKAPILIRAQEASKAHSSWAQRQERKPYVGKEQKVLSGKQLG